MDIGIFGLWGMNIPGVTFGGFETVYSEVGARLADRGHNVVIYCRRERYPKQSRLPQHRGVRLKYVPSIDTKSLSAISATWIALADSLLHEKFDVCLFANVGMGFHCAALKLLRRRVVLNVDGLDWQRAKWNWLARLYFRHAARVAIVSCDELIADSRAMQKYYIENFGRTPSYITYGAHIVQSINPATVSKYGVEARRYFLIVSRFVPENNLHLLIEAYEKTSTGLKLLIVGGTNHPTDYEMTLRKHESEHVIFTGYIADRAELNDLFCNCYAYLHGHSVGGTNPALLDALGAGCCVLAIKTPFTVEMLADGQFGVLFDADVDSAAYAMRSIVIREDYSAKLRDRARTRIREAYNWERVIDQYEFLLGNLMMKSKRRAGLPV